MIRILLPFALVVALVPAASGHAAEHLAGGFMSPSLTFGQSWNWTLPRDVGTTVYYHCHQHPSMEAIVDVVEGASDSPRIQIVNYSFIPYLGKGAPGANVTWTNEDNDTHSVIQSQPPMTSSAKSGSVAPAATVAAVMVTFVLARRPDT